MFEIQGIFHITEDALCEHNWLEPTMWTYKKKKVNKYIK